MQKELTPSISYFSFVLDDSIIQFCIRERGDR